MNAILAALRMREDIYGPTSKVQVAPPPVFRMISFGSIVHLNLETLSVLEPAAPWEGAPGSSLASRPVSVRFQRREAEIAAARRDIDIGYAANRGIRIDGDFRIRASVATK